MNPTAAYPRREDLYLMKVLFIEDVIGTAYAGDIKEVKNGFARNHLLPKNLAVAATPDQMNRVERLRRSAATRRDEHAREMSDLSGKIEGATVTIEARAGRNDRLYGSITNAVIAEEVSKLVGEEIDRRTIVTDPIRQLGSYQVPVKLGHGIEPTLTLVVTPVGGVREEEATAEEVVETIEAVAEVPVIEATAAETPSEAEAGNGVETAPEAEAGSADDEPSEEPAGS